VDVTSALNPTAAIAASEMTTLRDMMLSAVRGTEMRSPLSRTQIGKRFIADAALALASRGRIPTLQLFRQRRAF
jgi:hypothetical protein